MDNSLLIFKNRLEKIGISIEYFTNYPWVYIYKINDKIVKEKNASEHAFTIAYLPIKANDNKIKFVDLNIIFKLLRKYASL